MNVQPGQHSREQLLAAITVRDTIGISGIDSITPLQTRAALGLNYVIERGNPFNTTLGPCARCHRTTERYGENGSPICIDCKEGAH